MKWAIIYAALITAGFAAARGQEARNVTTQPATRPNVLTVPELFALADEALAMERPVKGVDRYWLVAVALQESGGDPTAVGDGGLARGLHQFHPEAWKDCYPNIDDFGYNARYNPLSSFRAAIRYAGKYRKNWRNSVARTIRMHLSTHHHLGHWDSSDKDYYNRVERRYQTLVKEYGGK